MTEKDFENIICKHPNLEEGYNKPLEIITPMEVLQNDRG